MDYLPLHKYQLGDKVYYPADQAAFIVVGIRRDQVEIEGDFSGGTHCVIQRDWVDYNEVKPYDITKVKFY